MKLVPQMVEDAMAEINKLTGRNYQLFNYYGDPNADRVIIAMGSLCDTAMEVVDYLNAKGEKSWCSIHSPLQTILCKTFLKCTSKKLLRKIAVMDRTKEAGSIGEPLYLEIQSALYNSDLLQQSLVVVMVLVVKMLLQIKSLQFYNELKKRCS